MGTLYIEHKLLRVINASAAVTLLEQRPEKNFQALSGIRTHDLCDAGAVLSELRLCSSSVTAALALMTVITQLLLWGKLLSSLLYLVILFKIVEVLMSSI